METGILIFAIIGILTGYIKWWVALVSVIGGITGMWTINALVDAFNAMRQKPIGFRGQKENWRNEGGMDQS